MGTDKKPVKIIMHGCNGKMGQVISGLIASDAGLASTMKAKTISSCTKNMDKSIAPHHKTTKGSRLIFL